LASLASNYVGVDRDYSDPCFPGVHFIHIQNLAANRKECYMGILTRKQGMSFVIGSDRGATDAPTKRPPKGRLSCSVAVWTGDRWSAVTTEAITFDTLDDADEYVRANFSKVAGQLSPTKAGVVIRGKYVTRSKTHEHRVSKRHRARHGTTLVQTAITLPMMLLFLWGIVEYSKYVTMLLVNNAAREGCRYAVMQSNTVVISGVTYGNADSDVKNLVTNCLGRVARMSQSTSVYGSDSLGNSNGITWQNTRSGQWITVKISGSVNSLLPTFLHMPRSFSVAAESVMRSEGN
jgi:Flp pilus assembly protein TadG